MSRSHIARVLILSLLATTAWAEDPPAETPPDAAGPSAVDKQAEAELTKGIAVAPKDAVLRHKRAEVRASLGDAKGAIEDLKKANEIDPAGFPLDIELWRSAITTARKTGGAQEPDLGLIQAEIEAIRGKKFKSKVASGVQSPEDFGKMVSASIDEELPKDRRDDVHAGLQRLGLLPAEFDLQKEVTGALQSQAAAYYDPKTDTFFILMGGMATDLVETTAAHELVHALQDQYFDLEAWFAAHGNVKLASAPAAEPAAPGAPPPAAATEAPGIAVRDDDRTLALRCLVEGEATYVQTLWQLQHTMGMAADTVNAAARMSMPMVANMEIEQLVALMKQQTALIPPGSDMANAMDQMEKIQPYILAPLFGAYFQGAAVVAAVEAKGWEAVDALYTDPPITSEQCLHPAKYTKKRDMPTLVALPEVPEIAAAGWRIADTARHGELYFRVLLKRNGGVAKTVKKAADGWDGDIYRAWRSADGRTAIALATTWDTDKDAAEFAESYRAALAQKYPKMKAEPGEDPLLFLYACGDDALGAGALLHRGREVIAIEGFPADLRAKMLVKFADWKVEHVD